MAAEGPFSFLQSWYLAQLNGYWEHGNGVTIESLATPGWAVTIDVAGTALEERAMQPANPINPQRVAWELSPRLPERAIITFVR